MNEVVHDAGRRADEIRPRVVDERAPVAEIYDLQKVYERIIELYFERIA